VTFDSAQRAEVLVVGAGAVGLSTAFALLKAGLSVSVVSAGGVGDGATAANAGLLVPADSLVWPGPENARAVPKTILGRGGASISIDWSNPATYFVGSTISSEQHESPLRALDAGCPHAEQAQP
jgi:hypothetical protein